MESFLASVSRLCGRMRGNMKQKKALAVLLMISLLIVSVLGGCSSQKTDTASAEYESQIQQLQAEINRLNEELAQYTASEEGIPESTPSSSETAAEAEDPAAETGPAAETAAATETVPETETTAVSGNQPAVSENDAEGSGSQEDPGQDSDRTQIVVFGDSIWDSTRDETGIAYLVSEYMDADVYNCAIGGTRATLKPGEATDNYDTWDSTSLSGMVNVALGKVDPEIFLEGYIAGGVIRDIDFSKTDYFIIAYGLNDYFAGAPLNADNYNSWDAHGYGGALRFAIDRLRGAFPDAQILLISPNYCQFWKDGYMYTDSNMKNFGGGTLTDYANVCRNVAETQNTLFIDGYSTLGINTYTAEDYLEDGIHLTEDGRELYAKAVSSCLKYGKPGEVSGNSVYY